jgi:hypothetical protein
MSYTILRGHWFHIIVLNVHAPTEDKIDDLKDNFYQELERIFDKFPKCCMKNLLGDLNAKVDSENIFKSTIGNESLHEISDHNGDLAVNLLHLCLTVKRTMFQHCSIHQYTSTFLKEKPHNLIHHNP